MGDVFLILISLALGSAWLFQPRRMTKVVLWWLVMFTERVADWNVDVHPRWITFARVMGGLFVAVGLSAAGAESLRP